MKQQVKLLQNESNILRMELESLLKVTELLSVQQKNITVKETGKSNKSKLNHQQDYRIPLGN